VEKKKKIEEMYFIQKKNLTEIAQELQTSISYISKILRANDKYKEEKENRKKETHVKRRKQQKDLIYNKRKEKIDTSYQIMKQEHEKAIVELSKRSKLGDNALRKWCSLYKFNKERNQYEFDTSKVIKPIDFPMYIKA